MQKPLIPIISADELQSLLEVAEAADTVVVDCRFALTEPDKGRQLWAESHIKGAFYADLDKDLASDVMSDTGRHPLPDECRLCNLVGSWGVTPDTRVVVYDDAGGAIAARLWWLLRWLGHGRVQILDGGLVAWKGATGSDQPELMQAAYPGTGGHMPVLTVDDVVALQDRSGLLDARDARRFAGEVEPIDPVAGHIPGASNMPFQELLTDDGKFKQKEDLIKLFSNLSIDGVQACMCGSGVTGCHLIAGAELAGLPTPALYVGSWSEWVRDPGRGVATDS